MGMVAAGKIAVTIGNWSGREALRQDELIKKARLPLKIPSQLDKQAIITALKSDKKVQDRKVRFVIPTEIGLATITDRVTTRVMENVI